MSADRPTVPRRNPGPSKSPSKTPSPIPRRRFIQAAGIGAVGLAGGGTAAASTARRQGARNVILMASDGMSAGTLTLADMMIRARTGERSNWVKLWDEPGVRRSMCRTHAADSLVTDSAAAGSAWGSGAHINNGAVNVTPGGVELEPILVTAKRRGLGTGLVTTTRITHATPASFLANVPSRNLEDAIGAQILTRGVDVALGGGARHFPRGVVEQHGNVRVVRTAEELRAAPADGRLLGVFDDSHVPYVLDRGEGVPTLPEMSRAALDRLSARGDGFVLQIEGGRVDHAAHANDAPSLVAEQVEFDEAIGVARAFALGRTDTLLIITTDHANANPGLTLYGEQGNEGFERLSNARHSFDWLGERAGELRTSDAPGARLRELVAEMTGGVDISDADAEWVLGSFLRRERTDGFLTRSMSSLCALGSVLANHYGVAFLSPNHTADLVEVTAIGPGAERLEAASDNTDLHAIMTAALGIRQRDPAGAVGVGAGG